VSDSGHPPIPFIGAFPMSHWHWRNPPVNEMCSHPADPDDLIELRNPHVA
jgi:hypothetical protein